MSSQLKLNMNAQLNYVEWNLFIFQNYLFSLEICGCRSGQCYGYGVAGFVTLLSGR